MTKNNLLLILCAVALAAVYVIWFTDWFHPKTVKIFHTSRNLRLNYQRGQRGGPLQNLIFGVSRPVQMTELKVVAQDAFQTNKNILPVWHLVSDSNSVPVKTFFYGQNIGGMHPALKGVRADALETNVPYLMLISAGKIKGEHSFTLQ